MLLPYTPAPTTQHVFLLFVCGQILVSGTSNWRATSHWLCPPSTHFQLARHLALAVSSLDVHHHRPSPELRRITADLLLLVMAAFAAHYLFRAGSFSGLFIIF
jgi:hypothetical protein